MNLYLGIDGGGTKTTAWLGRSLVNGELKVLGKGLAGPGNVRSQDFSLAMQNVHSAILGAFADAKLTLTCVHKACLCLAGAGREAEQRQVANWIAEHCVAHTSRIVGDAEVILAATDLPLASTGIALIAGTGSMAWGKTAAGQTARSGGWGYLYGDEGSAFALGSALLQQVTQSLDGRNRDAIQFADRVLTHLNLSNGSELVAWTYESPFPRITIASLAPLVFTLARDFAAVQDIILDGAQELANSVSAVAEELDSREFSLAAAGGLLAHQPNYLEYVLHALTENGLVVSHLEVVREPVLGALRIAHADTSP